MIAQSNTQKNEGWAALMIAFIKVTALMVATIHAWELESVQKQTL